jgi:hypothetical protein
MATFYATGLRCDELCKLKVPDIQGQQTRSLSRHAGESGI